MEKEIKILEEMKKDIVYDSDEDYDNQIAIRQIQAIENLIKAYRELEEKNRALEKGINRLKTKRKELSDELIDVKVDKVTRDFIPKSKIKEYMDKIQKELDKRKVKGMYIAIDGDVTDDDINTWIIQRATLQELIKD